MNTVSARKRYWVALVIGFLCLFEKALTELGLIKVLNQGDAVSSLRSARLPALLREDVKDAMCGSA
jgi:hypothetical protein